MHKITRNFLKVLKTYKQDAFCTHDLQGPGEIHEELITVLTLTELLLALNNLVLRRKLGILLLQQQDNKHVLNKIL